MPRRKERREEKENELFPSTCWFAQTIELRISHLVPMVDREEKIEFGIDVLMRRRRRISERAVSRVRAEREGQ